jgi:hypothetical protein
MLPLDIFYHVNLGLPGHVLGAPDFGVVRRRGRRARCGSALGLSSEITIRDGLSALGN